MNAQLFDEQFRIEEWMAAFKSCYRAKLNAILESGFISEEDLNERPMTVARCALVLTAEKMAPLSPNGKRMLDNLRNLEF